MTFLTAAALAVGLLVALPLAAHLLRRRHAEERDFPPARLLEASPPEARRRSRIEDRALLGVRAVAILGLALLGATPFVSCSHLSLERRGGASVAIAIVLDDSLSMRAPPPDGGRSRFERAREGALDLVRGARAGDAVAVILAGSPARVALAPTTDLGAAEEALRAASPTDRATDLDGALQLSRDLVARMPQLDRRVVLLSDLRDGRPSPALAGDADVSLWAPLADLVGGTEGDCALLGATRSAAKADVRIACTKGDGPTSPSEGRAIVVRREGSSEVLARLPLPATLEAATYTLDLPPVPEDAALSAELDGRDAIAEDDRAFLAPAGSELIVGVVSDPAKAQVETGGPPPVEQALAALGLGSAAKALAATPDEDADLAPLGALVIDDPPGFTPEQRRALTSWIEGGGTLLLALGPTSEAAPLGSGFAGIVPGVVRWGESPARGADVEASGGTFGVAARGLVDLAPRGRAQLEPAASEGADVLATWQDGAPLVLRRRVGRGSAIVLTLPLSAGQSDFVLRPAFLALLDRVAELARAARGTAKVEVGQAIALDAGEPASAELLPLGGGAPAPVAIRGEGAARRLEPELAGRYRVRQGDAVAVRIATLPAREIDFRVRAVEPAARAADLGGEAPTVDASPFVAVALLALFAIETALRLWTSRRATAADG